MLGDFVGMQAQEFQYALWSFPQRMAGGAAVTRTDTQRAFDDGLILRTHVLRPTWHFALPQDIRWMLRLTAPKLRRIMGSYTRQAGLDRAELNRTQDVLAGAVQNGKHCTRKDLIAALEAAGIAAGGGRLTFILMHAEYDEVLISGAMQGKQQTYAAFDERVPRRPDLHRGRGVGRAGPALRRDPGAGDRQGPGRVGQPDPGPGEPWSGRHRVGVLGDRARRDDDVVDARTSANLPRPIPTGRSSTSSRATTNWSCRIRRAGGCWRPQGVLPVPDRALLFACHPDRRPVHRALAASTDRRSARPSKPSCTAR